MLTMLVVDDENYALQAISRGIDWSGLPIAGILEAGSAPEARRILLEQPVDLLISDIEMPGANGLELLKWIRDSGLNPLTIFLTGHARFEYAQEALQQGCFDYVLKPVDHDILKEIVRRGVEEIGRRREKQAFGMVLEQYRAMWIEQLPVVAERFWQEVLAGRMPLAPERLNRQFRQMEIGLCAEDRVLPVLVSVEQWNAELNARDESIMEYALRKAAAETILGDKPGTVIQDRSETNVVLLYLKADERPDRHMLAARCKEYVEACGAYFHCRVSCYIGGPGTIAELPAAVELLLQLERENVSSPQAVIDTLNRDIAAAEARPAAVPSFLDWGILLDNGGYEQLTGLITAAAGQLQSEAAGRQTLELFRFGFLHMLYQAALRKGISVDEVWDVQELTDPQSSRSPGHLRQWAVKAVLRCADAFRERQRDASAVVAKVQSFIQDNLHKEIGRDDIARSVYRNPAYLSRLFRKETGLSLTDYITYMRIEKAKQQLAGTNDKVSNIAEGLGYVHFSYFAKLFKKMTGVSPQEYRKKHQVLQ